MGKRNTDRPAGFSAARDLNNLPNGQHADRLTRGLYVQVKRDREAGRRSMSWLYRWKPRGQGAKTSQVMGLGPCDGTADNMASARKRAAEARELILDGKDPREERQRQREAEAAKLRPRPTFKEFAEEYVKRREAEWRNPVHRQQWRNTLGLGGAGKRRMKYCDSLHSMRIDKVDGHAIRRVLDPIWSKIPETASRLRGRLERILDAAKADGYRTGDNPAAWRGAQETRYSAKSKIREVKHHAALPFSEIPGFIEALRERVGVAEACIELIVLTATRSKEARGARWDELDWQAKRWTIPPTRMKRKRPHAVPLSDAALAVLKRMDNQRTGAHVFPGLKAGTGISDTALRNVLRDMGYAKEAASIHGMRSSFRDWCGEMTAYPREVCEHALAHGLPDATERAYFRSDLFDKRIRLMADWAAFIHRTQFKERAEKIANAV